MSNDYSPDADDQMPEKKSSQQLLLLLLLLLVVLFGYLYFFTGLIKPRGEQPKPQPIAEAPVKTPLPPRPGAKGAEPSQPAGAVAKAEAHKAAAPPAVQSKPGAPAKEAPPAKPAGGATTKSAPPANQAKVVQPAAPVSKAKVGQPSAPATAKGAPSAVPATAKGVKPTAPPVKEAKAAKAAASTEKKPATKPPVQAKLEQKQAAGEKTLAAAGKKPKGPAKPAAAYALEINGDLAESEIAPVMAKLKQAGITHLVKSKAHKGEPMHRLFLADFANRDEALEELERLKVTAPSAFMLKENARYAVYAGSYLRAEKAGAEQNRLLAKGVQLLLKSATAPVAVYRVRAGAFADKAGADRAAKAAKKAGLSPKVVKLAQVAK